MKFCKQCLLPAEYLNIEIDETDLCQHCRQYQEPTYLGIDKLKADIQEALKKNTSKKVDNE